MHKNHYSGGLTREQFLFYEIKIVAGLLGRGRSRDEKYRSQQLDFSVKDVNVFFMSLAEKVPAVSEWSESTMKKLKQVLVRFLVECEYLESSKSQTLLPVYLYPELDELIRSKGDTDALAAFNCFN